MALEVLTVPGRPVCTCYHLGVLSMKSTSRSPLLYDSSKLDREHMDQAQSRSYQPLLTCLQMIQQMLEGWCLICNGLLTFVKLGS